MTNIEREVARVVNEKYPPNSKRSSSRGATIALVVVGVLCAVILATKGQQPSAPPIAEQLVSLLVWGVILALYMLPAIVATRRRHRNRQAITVLNALLGWTVLGWIAALIWASTVDVEQ
jgi:predicted membrane protein